MSQNGFKGLEVDVGVFFVVFFCCFVFFNYHKDLECAKNFDSSVGG